MKEKPQEHKEEVEMDKRFRTLFLILIPSLLIAIDYGNVFLNIGVKLLLFVFQFVVIKSILDDYYRY